MIVINESFLQQIHLTEDEFNREMALWLFSNRKISFGIARKLAGMDVLEFQELLDKRNIPLHYDVEEYLSDLKTLQILS